VLDWKLLGLWCGVAIALFFISVTQTIIILRTDWDKVYISRLSIVKLLLKNHTGHGSGTAENFVCLVVRFFLFVIIRIGTLMADIMSCMNAHDKRQ
jgi:hypothetical protein